LVIYKYAGMGTVKVLESLL